jgi:hypothetical protein
MLRRSLVFDIGDEDSLHDAVAQAMWSIDRHSYLGVVPEKGEPYGMILYNRGSSEYYRRNIEPRIELLHDVAEKLSFIGYFGVLFTFTTDTKLFGSQTGAWLSMKDNVNRVLSWARKGATGKRRRVHRVSDAVFKTMVDYYTKHPSRFVELDADDNIVVFSNVRLPLKAYIRVAEDTEACYPAPHGVFYFSNGELLGVVLTKDAFVQLFNDELTCECDEQGFTHVSAFPENVDDSTFAVSYATKYIQKQMNPRHIKYDMMRSVTWMVCLRSVGCRMFSMSNIWRDWYRDLHGLNNIENNSNDSVNVCYHFADDFCDLNVFMVFFKDFLTYADPPSDHFVREYVGFSADSNEDVESIPVPRRVIRHRLVSFHKRYRDLVSEHGGCKKSLDVVVPDKVTKVTRFDFTEEFEDVEFVPVYLSHCKSCRFLSICPRKSCHDSVSCIHCCCSEADILDDSGECFLAKVVFPNGFQS